MLGRGEGGREESVGLLLKSGLAGRRKKDREGRTTKRERYGSQNRSRTNLISVKRASVRNSARQLCRASVREREGGSERDGPAEDGVSGLEDGVVDVVVGRAERGHQLLREGYQVSSSLLQDHPTQTHLDEPLPLFRKVCLGHNGDGLAELDLERMLGAQREHDADDGSLESFCYLRRQRRRSFFILSFTLGVSGCPPTRCQRRLASSSSNMSSVCPLPRDALLTAQFALIQFLKLSAALWRTLF